ncbi:MAG: hypothetical protein JKY37_17555 [Nannocystaceae bacterium]|nr:hypothetical protein [Nannocystaceae bacterium]
MKLSPNGKAPVFQDGEMVLWESNAIMWTERHAEALHRWASVLNGRSQGRESITLGRFTRAGVSVSSALIYAETSRDAACD